MNAKRTLTIALLGLSLAGTQATAQAGTFRAENRIKVISSGGSVFTAERRDGARGAWCAAADYALTVLGAGGTRRIYVAPLSTSNRNSVRFTLDPAGLTPVSVLSVGASIKQPGANLSVNHACGFCADFRLINRG